MIVFSFWQHEINMARLSIPKLMKSTNKRPKLCENRMVNFKLTDAQLARYYADGYLVVESLFDEEEIELLLRIAKSDQRLAADAYSRTDGDGGVSRLVARNVLEDDIYCAVVRSPRLIDPIEQMLDCEIYHWNHKVMMKEPRVGGAWEWHQDYGYWYVDHSVLFPLLASCMIALDPATKNNGCLQAIRGSHRLGRVEHVAINGQMSADPERVEVALDRMELVYCEMQPGAALFFDCNLIHRSDRNCSENPRWAMICSYNAACNSPFKRSPTTHPAYSKLERSPDESIKQIGRHQLARKQP